jgi:hypothetical protein
MLFGRKRSILITNYSSRIIIIDLLLKIYNHSQEINRFFTPFEIVIKFLPIPFPPYKKPCFNRFLSLP